MPEEITPDTDTENEVDVENTETETPTTDWEAKYREEARQSQQRRKRAQTAEKKLAEVEGRVLSAEDIEAFERLKAEQAERAEAEEEAEQAILQKKGEFDKLVAKEADKHKASMAQKDKAHREAMVAQEAESSRLAGIVAKLGAENPLQAALAKANVQSVSQAVFYIQNSPDYPYHVISGLDDKGVPMPKVVDQNGDEVIDPKEAGTMMTVEGMVANFIGTDFGQRFMPPSGDTGSGAQRGVATKEKITYKSLVNDKEARDAYVAKNGPGSLAALLLDEDKKKREQRGS